MKRRVYFLFPDVRSTARVVTELREAGFAEAQLHTVARDDIDLGDLPPATPAQRSDLAHRLEDWLWGGNLALFFVLLAAWVVWMAMAPSWWSVILLVLAAACVALGYAFVRRVPDTHLDEFATALTHGEILLMVDVPARRVREVEALVAAHHPEALTGGVSWTMDLLHV